MDVSTPREFIEEVMPERFDPAKAAGLTALIQLKITGEDGGEWSIHIRDGKMEVNPGGADSPNISLTMKDKDYVALVNGKLSGQRAFMTGKLKFKGDMGLGMKLQKLGFI